MDVRMVRSRESVHEEGHDKKFQCSQCSETFRFRRHYDKHLEGHKQNNCKYCCKLFTNRKDLVKHLLEEHKIKLQDSKHVCQYCDKRFVKKLALYQHYRSHANGKHVCLHCGLFVVENNEYTKHLEKHNYEKPFKCKECNEKFSRPQQYLLHMKGHEKYKCLTCMESFSAQCKLMEHKRKGHQIKEFESKHVCNLCQRTFHLHRALVLHLRSHRGEESFNCGDCNKTFNSKKSYRKHLNTVAHRGKKDKIESKEADGCLFICDVCGKVFQRKLALSLHVSRIHSKEEPKKCSYCDYKSRCKANLKRHMEFHTADRKFICECCGASFHLLCNLKEHCLHVHSEERNFECTQCGKSFKRRCGLNRHMKDHSEDRPHVCHCGQSYKRMSHLKRHKESSHGYVSTSNKLCRLRRNDLGVLVPVMEVKGSKNSKKKTSVVTKNKSTCANVLAVVQQEERVDDELLQLDVQGGEFKSPNSSGADIIEHSHCSSLSNAELEPNPNVIAAGKEIFTNSKSTKENEKSKLLVSQSNFSLQEVDIVPSTLGNAEHAIFSLSSDALMNVAVVGSSEKQSVCQDIGLTAVEGDRVISHSGHTQVMNVIQESQGSFSGLDFVQVVTPANTFPEDTMVLLCFSSLPNASDGEGCVYSMQ